VPRTRRGRRDRALRSCIWAIPTSSAATPTDKIKRLLAAHGATLADVVKQVVYVTDIRYQADVGKCRREAYGGGPIPANTFLVINGLAIQGMLLEIDVTAVVAAR